MRTIRMAAWGTLIGGPILAVWYRSLHTAMESLSVSYAPVVGTRLAWLAERTPAMSWVADLHKPEVVKVSAGRMLLGKVVLDTTLFQVRSQRRLVGPSSHNCRWGAAAEQSQQSPLCHSKRPAVS